MRRFRVRRSPPLRGAVTVPGDKSIGHRALLFAALSDGRSVVRGLSGGLDHAATAGALRAMGVRIAERGGDAVVDGVGLDGLRPAGAPLDCGNSGTTMRLLTGLLSAQPFESVLVGDASLTRRPMRRVAEPLRARGARVEGAAGRTEGELYPPLRVGPAPSEGLMGVEYDMPVASAQVKSALLLSGLYARGPTALREPVLSRDHTERMLLSLGAQVECAGPMVVLDPTRGARGWPGFDWSVPGDLSSAAFSLIAACTVPGSDVTVEGVGLNPTRTGLLDALRAMRVFVESTPKGAAAGDEPCGDLRVRGVPAGAREGRGPAAAGAVLGGEVVTRMIDEVPALSVLAAVAGGVTEIRDARELRVKESDRIAALDRVLTAFGVPCRVFDDGLAIEGGARLRAARVASDGDHRIAMSAALLGLLADGETLVEDVACVDTSYPGFADMLRSLGAPITVEEDDGPA